MSTKRKSASFLNERKANLAEHAPSLKIWNWVAFGIHLGSFAVLLTLYLALAAMRYVNLTTDFDGATVTTLATYSIAFTLMAIPAVAALFRLAAVLGADNYYDAVLNYGDGRLRWCQYAITNGLVVWTLFSLVNASNIFLLVAGFVANVWLQVQAYRQEVRNNLPSIVKGSKTTAAPIMWGALPWLFIWSTILAYHISNISTVPLYEIFAVFGALLFALLMVLPLVYRYNKKPLAAPTTNIVYHAEANYRVEVAYILLSLLSTIYVDYAVTIGYLVA